MTSVGSISAQVLIDSSKVGPALAALKSQTSSAMGEIEGRASKMGDAIGNALKVGLLAGTAAVGAALVGGTKAYADYEQGLASVAKTTGLTGKELESLGGQLRDLAKAGPVTVGEFEKIASAAGSLGIGAQKMASGDLAGAREEIVAFSKTMSDMAIAFEMDVETVSTSMADIGNVYKVPTEGLAVLGSQINSLENSMSATAPQIIDFMSAFGGTATMFGESAEKTAAFGATLSQLGVKGTEASTQLRSGVLQLTQSSKEGQANLEKMAKLMGVSVDQLKRDIDQDLYGSLIKMGQAFKKIQGDTAKAAEAQKIFGAYGYSALIKLGDGADEYAQALELVNVKGDELQKEAATMANTLSGQWQRLKNNIYDVGISIGSVTSGPLRDFLAFLNDSLIPATKTLFEALAKGDWDTVQKSFQTGIEAIKKQIEGIGSYITSLPWGQWFDQIAQYFIKTWDAAPEKVKPALDKLASFLASGAGVDWGGATSKLIQLIATYIKDTIETVLEIGDWIHDKVVSWIDSGGPKKLGEDIMNAIAGGIKSLLGSASKFDFWGALKAAFSTAAEWGKLGLEIIKGIASGMLDRLLAYLSPVANKMLATFATAAFEVQGVFARAWNTILVGAATFVEGLFTTLAGIGQKLADQLAPLDKYFENLNKYYGEDTLSSYGTPQYYRSETGARVRADQVEEYKAKHGGKVALTPIYPGTTSTAAKKAASTGLISQPISAEESAQIVSNLQWAGWMTGGKGFVSEELQSAGEGKLYMITEKGDFVTLTGKEVVAKSVFDLIAPYTADYVTNSAEAGQAFADKVMPVADMITEAADESANITKEAAIESATTTTTKLEGSAETITSMWAQQAEFFKNAVSNSSDQIKAAGSDVASRLSQAGQNALAIGQQVAGNLKGAGDAVRVGLDASGRQIAVIGSVAQRQFEAAGGKWISDASIGGTQAKTAMQSGGSAAQTALQSGASAISSAASSLGRVGASAWGGPLYTGALWHAEGTVTNGPELAVIGEEGKEFVIPTKRKRWDLLLAAMRAYGIRGFAEGGAAGAAGSEVSEAQEMTAYFGIKGLASMAKQVKKIISDLKEFFRITWGIIKSEGAVYWKQIETIITNEAITIRDASWQAALDIRNQWISANQAIAEDMAAKYAAIRDAVGQFVSEMKEDTTANFEDLRGQVNLTLESMINDANTQFGVFKSEFNSVWVQITADLQSTVSQISSILSSIGAQLSNINVNASVNLSSYGGGGGGWDMGGSSGGGSIGGGGGNDWSSVPTTFTDTTCLGDTVTVNALKYTSPSGVVTYINPLSGNFRSILAAAESGTLGSSSGQYAARVTTGGGVSSWIDSGNWDFWAAQGALLDQGPQRVVAGEAGPELILPAKLTRMFLSLADAGIGMAGGSGRLVIEDHTVHELYIDGKKVTDAVMSRAVQKLRLKGAAPVR